MSKTLVEMAAEIVGAQATHSKMNPQEISEAISTVFRALKRARTDEEGIGASLDERGEERGEEREEKEKRELTPRGSIQKNRIICLECGQAFKQLSRRHLEGHSLSPKDYKKKYGMPMRQALAAKAVSEQRRRVATEKGLGKKLVEARRKKAAEKSGRGVEAGV
ncbi:MAG: MucR family transcriptional regulator [Candidatus Tectomicrobia bacterium]|uniref:MucR family transcriptional regulator n=1 Tax=Tectimicrobiota bacterium TaxID=2528274 RepID=A0A932CPR5_UNCTE|nr:MucR family transcriptional regulator [Candidatus Tectomicrobia bacterium]